MASGHRLTLSVSSAGHKALRAPREVREEGDAEKVESSFVQGPNQGSPKFTMCCNSAGAKMRSGRNGNRFLNRSRECTALRLDGRRARRGLHDAAAAPPARLARRSRRRRTRTRTATGTRKERERESAYGLRAHTFYFYFALARPLAG